MSGLLGQVLAGDEDGVFIGLEEGTGEELVGLGRLGRFLEISLRGGLPEKEGREEEKEREEEG